MCIYLWIQLIFSGLTNPLLQLLQQKKQQQPKKKNKRTAFSPILGAVLKFHKDDDDDDDDGDGNPPGEAPIAC